MASLTIREISKRFDRVTALSRVDLRVRDGEFCVLLGPSGCGKRTLLQIIAGLISQDEGTILLDGSPVDRLSPRERDVAMVFQSYALYPHMTVSQNLGFGLRMRGISKPDIAKRVQEAARLLGIESLLARKPRQLSGGQRQRVAMGRALVRRPRLFLLDEPLSNLDARLRISLRLELKRLHRQIQGTILYVTHDQVEAMTLGDKVVVMREGRIHQIDTPDRIYQYPADTFVATFIGSPEMNLLKGRLLLKDGAARFVTHDFSLDPGALAPELEGSEVEIGIRPEDILLGEGAGNVLRAGVDMISNVGAEQYVHVRVGATALTVSASKEASFRPGEQVPLLIEPSRLHVFHRRVRVRPLIPEGATTP